MAVCYTLSEKLKHHSFVVMSSESDEIWRESVKTFIKNNYNVHDVTCQDIGILFNGHGTSGNSSTSYGISYQYIRNVFARKKDQKPPSKKMKIAFIQLQDIQAGGRLQSFPDLMLKGHRHPVFPVDVLAIFHMWSLTYELCPMLFPVVTKESLPVVVERRVGMFLQYCRGRFQIDRRLFVGNNIEIFKSQYLNYVERVTPKNEGPIIS